MDNDNGIAHNNQPPLGLQSKLFIYASHFFVNNFFILVYVFKCPYILILTFVYRTGLDHCS